MIRTIILNSLQDGDVSAKQNTKKLQIKHEMDNKIKCFQSSKPNTAVCLVVVAIVIVVF